MQLKHVRVAADMLFNSTQAAVTEAVRDVFVSYSHQDDDFIDELVKKLKAVGVTCFKADRYIPLQAIGLKQSLIAKYSCPY